MRRPVVGGIGNAHLVDDRFAVQLVGERNLRALAEVANALPLILPVCRASRMSAGCSTPLTGSYSRALAPMFIQRVFGSSLILDMNLTTKVVTTWP